VNQRCLSACHHCGLPAPANSPWRLAVDGVEQPMCCPGCLAVASSMAGLGLGGLYRQRTGQASAPSALPGPYAEQVALLSVEGVRCAACCWLIEHRLLAQQGVLEAELNPASAVLRLRWRGGAGRVDGFIASLAAIGYPACRFDASGHAARLERERRLLFKRLFVAGLAMMQVMMYVFPLYLASGGAAADMDGASRRLLQWAACMLTVPAVLYSAQPFWRGAWRGLRAGRPGMDLPVALGLAAGFGASVAALLRGQGETYFDAVSMFVFLLLASQYIELRARCAGAGLLRRLRQGQPPVAARLDDYPARRHATPVPAAALRVGDHVLVAPGEALAADGVIVDGATDLLLALLTGEPLPQPRAVGERAPGGAVNSGQPIVLRVTRVAAQSMLARLAGLVEGAGAAKPALALWADRVGAWFVLALLALAVLAFAAWYPASPARAWEVAVAVLVVSCPCALSLAAPAALAASTARLLHEGVLVVRPHVLETLARATHVVFDKTGTLTTGTPALARIDSMGPFDRAELLRIAAALEAGSRHPFALAIAAAAAAAAAAGAAAVASEAASEVQHHAGAGVSGCVAGRAWRLGSAPFTGQPAAQGAGSRVYLADGERLQAVFTFSDTVRPDAAATIDALRRQGCRVSILSGDGPAAVAAVAHRLGITDWRAAQLPQQKLAVVQALQARGAIVAMVGDGVNDAAVLRAADVSFAMGAGSDLACLQADCVLLRDRLGSLATGARAARACMVVLRQNLAWALAYNACAIPAAAVGLLQPWMAAAGMSASSALVLLNALRLRRAPRQERA